MKYDEAEAKIAELATPDFMEKLVMIAKLYGWSGDYDEIERFVSHVGAYANYNLPDMAPYTLED
jgi:hypothetical protein